MNFIEKLVNKYKNLDSKIKKIMNIGILLSCTLCLVSSSILFTYEAIIPIPSLFYIGISLFRTSLMFICMFLMCAIGFDSMKDVLN